MEIKMCPKCNERPVGPSGYCPPCRREYQREYYHKRKETLRLQEQAMSSQNFLLDNDVEIPSACSECGRPYPDLNEALVLAFIKLMGRAM